MAASIKRDLNACGDDELTLLLDDGNVFVNMCFVSSFVLLLLFFLYLAQVGQADVDPGPQARAQVGRAGQDVPQALVPHELPAPLVDQLFHLGSRAIFRYVHRELLASQSVSQSVESSKPFQQRSCVYE